jgi:hypothetical protein
MNHLAKAAGVRKHHYPSTAREKLQPVNGRSPLGLFVVEEEGFRVHC